MAPAAARCTSLPTRPRGCSGQPPCTTSTGGASSTTINSTATAAHVTRLEARRHHPDLIRAVATLQHETRCFHAWRGSRADLGAASPCDRRVEPGRRGALDQSGLGEAPRGAPQRYDSSTVATHGAGHASTRAFRDVDAILTCRPVERHVSRGGAGPNVATFLVNGARGPGNTMQCPGSTTRLDPARRQLHPGCRPAARLISASPRPLLNLSPARDAAPQPTPIRQVGAASRPSGPVAGQGRRRARGTVSLAERPWGSGDSSSAAPGGAPGLSGRAHGTSGELGCAPGDPLRRRTLSPCPGR